MDKATEGLLNYGAIGIMAVLFLTAIVVLWFLMQNLYKRIIDGKDEVVAAKDKEISELLQRLEIYEDREHQRMRDTHQVMGDLNDGVKGLTNIALGFRELVNIIAERLMPNKSSL